jgi:hypothetical protein
LVEIVISVFEVLGWLGTGSRFWSLAGRLGLRESEKESLF